jgi:hypothetical protein
MPGGQVPKHQSVVQRRNRASTKAVLREVDSADVIVPPLPPLVDREGNPVPWHPQTRAWWADIFASPMSVEYHKSDIWGLIALAVLWNKFWMNPSDDAHKEIRLARKDFGQTPLDRMRLQWQLENTDEAQFKGDKRRAQNQTNLESVPDDDADPRFQDTA